MDKRQKVGNMGREPWGANAALGQAMMDAYVEYNVGLCAELREIKL